MRFQKAMPVLFSSFVPIASPSFSPAVSSTTFAATVTVFNVSHQNFIHTHCFPHQYHYIRTIHRPQSIKLLHHRSSSFWGDSRIPSTTTGINKSNDTLTEIASTNNSSHAFAFSNLTPNLQSDLEPKKVIFLGTPEVAATSLKVLHLASQLSLNKKSLENQYDPFVRELIKQTDIQNMHPFRIIAVVSRPPAPKGRKKVLLPSPVHELADSFQIPVLHPTTAKDTEFLQTLSQELQPDLCITAAYGNFLPQKFLDIPKFGTLNIHPSLLPMYRGAAPVPRSMQDGCQHMGVSVAQTVLAMDAGPILVQRRWGQDEFPDQPDRWGILEGHEKAPEVLDTLFTVGSYALLNILDAVWDGSAPCIEQDVLAAQNGWQVSHAPKLSTEEARLTFVENAVICHRKVNAFAGWPGTWAEFEVLSSSASSSTDSDGNAETTTTPLQIKVHTTRVRRPQGAEALGVHDVQMSERRDAIVVTCDDGSQIDLLEIQPLSKKIMDAKNFWNGYKDKKIRRKRLPY